MHAQPPLPAALLADLRSRHAEPHRRYHAVAHVEALLRGLAQWRGLALDPGIIEAAIWFHDAIYDVGAETPQDNEGASAELARSELTAIGWSTEAVARVCELILATRQHGAEAGDSDAWLFLDLDLSVLARSPSVYAEYVAGVRFEYQHVEAARFRAGRTAVLRSFLGREAIYRTPALHEAWEAAARTNLQAELEDLLRAA